MPLVALDVLNFEYWFRLCLPEENINKYLIDN
jgi:hypothetical protein